METTVFKSDFRDINGLYEACEWCKYTIIEKKTNFLVFSVNPFEYINKCGNDNYNVYNDFFDWVGKYLKEWQIKSIKEKIDNFELSFKDVESSINTALCFGLDNYKGKSIMNNIF